MHRLRLCLVTCLDGGKAPQTGLKAIFSKLIQFAYIVHVLFDVADSVRQYFTATR